MAAAIGYDTYYGTAGAFTHPDLDYALVSNRMDPTDATLTAPSCSVFARAVTAQAPCVMVTISAGSAR